MIHVNISCYLSLSQVATDMTRVHNVQHFLFSFGSNPIRSYINKEGYRASLVACGWKEAVDCRRPHIHFGRSGVAETRKIVWKKVEEYLRLFETYGGIGFSLFLMGSLRKLICFSGRMTLRMKLIAKKELILLFQMTPSRILCDH